MEELSPKHLVPTSQFTEKFSRRIAFYHEEMETEYGKCTMRVSQVETEFRVSTTYSP